VHHHRIEALGVADAPHAHTMTLLS
jgi:hypothetical protein